MLALLKKVKVDLCVLLAFSLGAIIDPVINCHKLPADPSSASYDVLSLFLSVSFTFCLPVPRS